MILKKFELTGRELRILAAKDAQGRTVYDVIIKRDLYALDYGQLAEALRGVREDIDSIIYEYSQDPKDELIRRMEEESRHAHRADADGKNGD